MAPDVFFDSDGVRLHGHLAPGDGRRAVVITHPHPLYGGDMNNPVVMTIAEVYRQAGYAVLRFNFRGVGRSGGNSGNRTGRRPFFRWPTGGGGLACPRSSWWSPAVARGVMPDH